MSAPALIEVAPLAGSVDRNNDPAVARGYLGWSLPSRGAWIEICGAARQGIRFRVAPLAGSVDRNLLYPVGRGHALFQVAPLAGSVDRNTNKITLSGDNVVAPLAGSVDRNKSGHVGMVQRNPSLPSRGAWIEI